MSSVHGWAPPVPVVESERLLLRGHRLTDFADCAAMWGDPEITRFIGGKPSTSEEVWGRILKYIGHWAAMGYGYWAVVERSSGRYVGDVGFSNFKRDIQPPLGDTPEMGWALSTWAQGKGYATEAVRAGLGWVENHLRAPKTVCLIDPTNLPSLRVAEKAGYRESHRTTYRGDPTIVLER